MARTSLKAYVTNDFAIIDSGYPSTHQSVSIPGPNQLYKDYLGGGKWMLCKFADPTASLGTKRLYEVRAVFQVGAGTATSAQICPLKDDYNKDTVTWNTTPEIDDRAWFIAGGGATTSNQDVTFWNGTDQSKTAKLYLQACTAVFRPSGKSYAFNIYTVLTDSTPAYFEFYYDDAEDATSQIEYVSGPTDGYSNPRNATEFTWTYGKSGDFYCAADFTQASATFYWKESEDESYTAVSISGSTKGVTIPANTFPANSSIDWYVQGTDTAGTTSQTEVYTFSTVAGTAYATAQKPISTVEDGSAPITFEWEFSSEDGQDPSGVDLQWKLPTELDSEFHSLLSNASPVTSYSAAAGTFSAGEIQWRVRAYNVDGTAGPWSKPATGYYSFICISAPDPPAGLNATAVPLSTISWQSAEQQGYEIEIDGAVVKKAFGAGTYRWTVEEPLADGTHTISVRVLGAYGFWSQPSTVTINISNTPPATITLGGSYDADAYLSWTFDTDPGEVITTVYRDGVPIGKTPETTYVDMTVLGTHDYYVITSDRSGNYSQSNTVTAVMHTDVKIMAPADRSAPWLELRLSENSMDTDEYQWTQTYATQHVTGAVYPQLDRSQLQDMTASYNCAFIKQEEIQAFESMKGKIVVLKSKGDHVVVGMLAQVQKRVTPFYTAYYFSIQQIHWY